MGTVDELEMLDFVHLFLLRSCRRRNLTRRLGAAGC
jgi:hypothetical protein